MELIDLYDYSSLVEKWYLETYKVEFDAYHAETNYEQKFQMSIGCSFEGTTEENDYIRLDVTNSYRFFLSKVKYGFTTFSEESTCEV